MAVGNGEQMKTFDLNVVRFLVEESLKEPPTGDAWLDARYQEQVSIIGHTNPYYRLFFLIAQALKPEFVVELGSWQATAAAHFALGNPGGEVITVDIHREDKEAQRRAIEAAGHIPNLTYLNMWSWDAVDTIKAIGKPISILFIDAWHDYVYAKNEWDLYSPLLADPALVICDDITTAYNFEGMLKFWDELPGEKFLDSRVHPGIPMGFVYVGPNREPDKTQQPTAARRNRPAQKSRAA